jgi:hypothetical protein
MGYLRVFEHIWDAGGRLLTCDTLHNDDLDGTVPVIHDTPAVRDFVKGVPLDRSGELFMGRWNFTGRIEQFDGDNYFLPEVFDFRDGELKTIYPVFRVHCGQGVVMPWVAGCGMFLERGQYNLKPPSMNFGAAFRDPGKATYRLSFNIDDVGTNQSITNDWAVDPNLIGPPNNRSRWFEKWFGQSFDPKPPALQSGDLSARFDKFTSGIAGNVSQGYFAMDLYLFGNSNPPVRVSWYDGLCYPGKVFFELSEFLNYDGKESHIFDDPSVWSKSWRKLSFNFHQGASRAIPSNGRAYNRQDFPLGYAYAGYTYLGYDGNVPRMKHSHLKAPNNSAEFFEACWVLDETPFPNLLDLDVEYFPW